MKRKFKILMFLLSAVIMFSACEEDERLYGDFDVNSSDLATTIQIGEPSPLVVLPGDSDGKMSIPLTVKVIGPLPTSDVTVPYTINSTTFPDDWYEMSAANFTIPAGSNQGTINLIVDLASMPLDSVFTFDYTIGTPSSYQLTDYVTSNMSLFKACPISIEDFEGTYEIDVDGDVWTGEVKVNPEEDNQIIVYGAWLSVDSTFFNVKIPSSLADPVILEPTAKTQIIGEFPGYGAVAFEEINGGIVTNTCVPVFEFNATPTLPDAGLWWGGEFKFILTKVGEKGSVNRITPLPTPR